ncbi:MAG: murein biosynthesis integral membrane protein MurJ [Opitutaceae bacterium]
MSKHLKNIGVVSGLTMVSRVLGLVRESITAKIFGVSPLISAFFTGQTLPNLFRRLLAEGALTASFVPTLHDELKARERAGAFRLVNQVTSWLLAASTAVVVLAMVLLGQDGLVLAVARLFRLDGPAQERWLLFSWFAVVLFPYLIFVSLAAAFSAALQTLHRFVEPALSPIWLNLAQIGLLLAAMRWAHGDQIIWLCAGVLLGGFLQMVVPAGALMREGWRPAFDFTLSEPVRAMLRLMAPTVFASSVYLVNMSVSRLVGLSLSDEAVALLNFAQRLMELPIGVFAVAVSTVVFPLITRYAAAGDHANLASSYCKGMRLILVINIPATIGLAVLALPIIRLLFQRGAFDAAATADMTPVLVANALGLPFFSFVNLALRAFYAQKDTRTPVIAALLSFAVNLILSFALMRPFGTVGLAVASTIAMVVQGVYLQWHLARKQEGLAFHHLAGDLGKIVATSFVMGLVVAAMWWGWSRTMPATDWADAGGLTLTIGCGVAVYVALLWVMKIQGRDDLAAMWMKLRAKFA